MKRAGNILFFWKWIFLCRHSEIQFPWTIVWKFLIYSILPYFPLPQLFIIKKLKFTQDIKKQCDEYHIPLPRLTSPVVIITHKGTFPFPLFMCVCVCVCACSHVYYITFYPVYLKVSCGIVDHMHFSRKRTVFIPNCGYMISNSLI